MKLTYIGENYPCVSDPSQGARTDQNSSKIEYSSSFRAAGSTAYIQLHHVKNYGLGPLLKGWELDPDTLQTTFYVTGAYYGSTAMKTSFQYKTAMAGHSSSGLPYTEQTWDGTSITVDSFGSYGVPFTGNLEIEANPEGGNWDLVQGHCKRIVFRYKFPRKANYYVTHIVENQGFTSGAFVTWCAMMTKVRENMPCTVDSDIPWSPLPSHETISWHGAAAVETTEIDWAASVKYDATNTSEFFRYVANTGKVQHHVVADSVEEDWLEIHTSVRADKLSPAGTTVPLQFTVKLWNGAYTSWTKDVSLTVRDRTQANSPETPYTDTMKLRDKVVGGIPYLRTYPDTYSYTTQGGVRDLIWVPYKIGVPREGSFPFKLFIQAPVQDGRAIFHLHTVRFPIKTCQDWDVCNTTWNGQGDSTKPADNILGVNHWVDIERTYDLQRIKSSRITSHMQTDQILVDFGLLTNAGYDAMWGTETDESDSTFWVWVGVEISDHPATTAGSVHKLHVSASIADTVLTAHTPVTVTRTARKQQRLTTVRPILNFTLALIDPPATIYKRGELVRFTLLVQHSNVSLGEVSPCYLRLVLDQYTGWVAGTNTLTSNYTGGDLSVLARDEANRQGSFLDIVLPSGLLFPDTVQLNFSLTADPLNRRQPEDNDNLKSTVKVTAYGDAAVHGTDSGYPTHNPIQVATYVGVDFNVESDDCYEEIQWVNPAQQIQSSFVMNWTEVRNTRVPNFP